MITHMYLGVAAYLAVLKDVWLRLNVGNVDLVLSAIHATHAVALSTENTSVRQRSVCYLIG